MPPALGSPGESTLVVAAPLPLPGVAGAQAQYCATVVQSVEFVAAGFVKAPPVWLKATWPPVFGAKTPIGVFLPVNAVLNISDKSPLRMLAVGTVKPGSGLEKSMRFASASPK